MGLSKKNYRLFISCFAVLVLAGCQSLRPYIDWTDTTGMEEYGNQVAETLAVLKAYIEKHKDEIRMEFGEPHEIDKRIGSKAIFNQQERVVFDEIWEYCYSRGFIMINFERGCKYFYFKDDIVVTVDAF